MLRALIERFRSRRREPRELIVNADDFGMSTPVNRGIARAVEDGIVTSCSLMVRREAALEAAAFARTHHRVSVGLHVDLGEWIRRNNRWEPLYVVTDLEDRKAITLEVRRQLDVFRTMTGTDPTHVDSHQHVHKTEPVRSILLDVAAELDVPLRHFAPTVTYCGQFYAQDRNGEEDFDAIGVARLVELVTSLDVGVTELCCHPGEQHDANEQYARARQHELQTLCDARVRAALTDHDIRLRSFHGLRAADQV
jgi:predicted glycoside hydrolase/deacetylase ChbG (UPF0249 family)